MKNERVRALKAKERFAQSTAGSKHHILPGEFKTNILPYIMAGEFFWCLKMNWRKSMIFMSKKYFSMDSFRD